MKSQIRLDPGLALVLLLSLFSAWPLALKPGLPAGVELAAHSALATELAQNLSGASLFAADIGLAHILGGSLTLLLGFGMLEAWRCLILLSILGSSGGMYLFSRRRSGRLGAVIAGLLFVSSPGLMYNLAYARGAYPELLALAVFPMALWRLDALRDKPGAANFLLAVAMQALLFASDNILAPGLAFIALVWIIAESLIQFVNRESSRIDSRSDGLTLLAILLGVAAAAIFWAPTPAEGEAKPLFVDESALRGDAGRSLEDLLAPPPLQDAGASNGLREFHALGLAQTGLALLGIAAAALIYTRGYRTRHPGAMLGTLLYALIALGLIGLTVSSAQGWWGDFFLWRYFQYSPGLLAVIAACLAIVAGANGLWLERLEARFQISLVALLVALPMLTAIPRLYVPEWRYETADAIIALPPFQDLSAIQSGATGALLSAASLLAAGAIAWTMRKRPLTPRPYWTTPALARPALIGIVLGALTTGLIFLVAFREGVAWLNSPPGQALPAQVQLDYTLDGVIKLLGYDLDAERIKAGESLVLRAYWYAPEATPARYASFLHLHGDGLAQMHVINAQPGDGAAAAGWRPDGYILDRLVLQAPADMPPGEYELAIGLFLCAAAPPDGCDYRKRASVTDALGQQIGDSIKLTIITVNGP